MKILIADDHDLFREGLSHLLHSIFDCHIIEASDYDTVNELCLENKDISLMLLDLDMPGGNSIESVLSIRKKQSETLIVVISGIESVDVVSLILESGIQGYIPKSSSSDIIKKAIELVVTGGIYIPPVTVSLFNRATRENINTDTKPAHVKDSFALTGREKEVLSFLVRGRSNKEIARDMGISAITVRTHTVSIYRTLNVNNRTQAGHIATKFGLV